MKNLATSLAVSSLLTSLLVGCASDPEGPTNDEGGHLAKYASDPFGPAPKFRPRTCQDIVDYVPDIKDGEYTLYINSEATLRWKVYCADMHGTPREYLPLEQVGSGANTSMYSTGTGTDVVTEYQRVRIDPNTLIVDIGDMTFATSTGSLLYKSTTVTSMPFGVAMTCGGVAAANLNLRGTAFRLDSAFPSFGTNTMPTSTLAADRKALDMTVKGDCGWMAPTKDTNPTSDAEQFVLRLAFFR